MSVVARPPTSPCPTVDELIAFVSASATDELRRTIEAHVDACADCRSTLADAVLAQHGSVTPGGVAGPPLASLEGTTLGRFTLGAQAQTAAEGQWLAELAASATNQARIDLVGLAAGGLVYA